MKKHLEASHPESCFNRAQPNEWVFVLLGRDFAAPVAIRAWVTERIRLGKNAADDPQVLEALACAQAMEEARHASADPPKSFIGNEAAMTKIPVPDVPAPTVRLCWQFPSDQVGKLHQHCRFPVGHEGLHEWELRRQIDATEATVMSVVHIVGGMVEGQPTSRVNFLQRVRKLVETEAAITQEIQEMRSLPLLGATTEEQHAQLRGRLDGLLWVVDQFNS